MNLFKELKTLRQEAKDLRDALISEDREPTEAELSRLAELKPLIESKAKAAGIISSFDDNDLELQHFCRPARTPIKTINMENMNTSIVNLLLQDPEFKSSLESAAKSANSFAKIGTIGTQLSKSLISTGSNANGAGLAPRGYSGVPLVGMRGTSIFNYATIIPVATDSIQVAVLTGMTNNAASQLQATSATATGSAFIKAESDLDWGNATVTLNSIAHWLRASKQIIADVPYLAGLVESQAAAGVMNKFENLFFTATSAANGWNGVDNTTGIQTQSFSTSVIQSIRKGMTKLQTNTDLGNYVPNAIFMHPTDWEGLQLLTTTASGGDYVLANPSFGGVNTLFGVPVVVSANVPVGFAYVGDWSLVQIFDRQSTALYISDSDGNNFTRNLVTLLVEARVAAGFNRPQCVCKVALS